MTSIRNLSISFSLFFSLYLTCTHATTFEIVNQCSYTVWAAAFLNGGRQLTTGQTWTITLDPSTTAARFWGRTNCKFDANGQGQCETGDCNGLLECHGSGKPPNTLAEIQLNQPGKKDYYDISLFDGFNIPMTFSPTTNVCPAINCTGNFNKDCPAKLRAPGGCNNACTVFQTEEYCCTVGAGNCAPNSYYQFFKERCPDAYPPYDQPNPFICPSGTNYKVVFCP